MNAAWPVEERGVQTMARHDAKEVAGDQIKQNLGGKNLESKLRDLNFILKPMEDH